jgi:hypothetical protein
VGRASNRAVDVGEFATAALLPCPDGWWCICWIAHGIGLFVLSYRLTYGVDRQVQGDIGKTDVRLSSDDDPDKVMAAGGLGDVG